MAHLARCKELDWSDYPEMQAEQRWLAERAAMYGAFLEEFLRSQGDLKLRCAEVMFLLMRFYRGELTKDEFMQQFMKGHAQVKALRSLRQQSDNG